MMLKNQKNDSWNLAYDQNNESWNLANAEDILHALAMLYLYFRKYFLISFPTILLVPSIIMESVSKIR
jgi:hypothetical protein